MTETTVAGAPTLSILIPLRTDSFDFYRQRLVLRDRLDLTGVETIIIDDGSPADAAKDIELYCRDRDYKYLRIESGDQQFSLARSRNTGIKAATSSWLYMEDADLIYCRRFFQDVVSQLTLLVQTPFNFLSMPAVYLTPGATAKVYDAGELDSTYRGVINSLLLEDPKGSPTNSVVESFSPASGVIALSRELALSVGGYDEEFSGWGGEDRDFIFRLMCANGKIQLPVNFEDTKSWNLNDTLVYEGWRSLHRLHGEFMARQGFYAVHLHHKQQAWRGHVSSARNMKLAAKKALKFKPEHLPRNEMFSLRYTVLFDVFRYHDVHGEVVPTDSFVEDLNRANRQREQVLGKSQRSFLRKLRKFFVSPEKYFEDSRYGFLRVLARRICKK